MNTFYKIRAFIYGMIGFFNGQGRKMGNKWELTFEDNFEAFDKDTWMTQLYWGTCYPHSLEAYTERAIGYSGSATSFGIEIDKKPTKGYRYTSDGTTIEDIKPYSSGLIQTGHGKSPYHPQARYAKGFTQKYGYFEIRCKLPKGKGMWPAFWLLTKDSVLPEIDIFEAEGHRARRLYFTYHYGKTYDSPNKITRSMNIIGCNFQNGFHTIGCEWTKDKLIWYVDGVKVGELKAEQELHGGVYPLISCGIYSDKKRRPNKKTKFPAYFEIDYIRIYKKKKAKDSALDFYL